MSVYQPSGLKKIFHDTRRLLARLNLSVIPAFQIAITGSQGKTATTKIISAVLNHLGNTTSTDTNLDSTYNIPITALKANFWTKYIVWELGVDHPGEMARHLEIVKPNIAIVTGISPVHTDIDHMGSLQTLIEEKRKLIEALPAKGYAILNYDDENVRAMAPFTKAKIVWYGTDPTKCEIRIVKNEVLTTIEGTYILLHDKDKLYTLKTNLIGTFHAYNFLAAYIVMKLFSHNNYIFTEFQKAADTIQPLRGRMNIEKGPLQTILLNDSLRANPESTRAGLETLKNISYTGRKIAVIGEMGELEKPEEEHRKTGQHIADGNFDYVLCIGPLRKFTIEEAIAMGFSKNRIEYANNVFEAADKLRKLLQPGDLWYLKGSLLRNYKRIVQLLNNEPVCCHEIICPYNHCGY